MLPERQSMNIFFSPVSISTAMAMLSVWARASTLSQIVKYLGTPPREGKEQINGYVEEQTKGKIVDLLSSLDTRTVLVLINYIYFRARYQELV
ncbi:plasma serine protease inhibitor-like [Lissotriton helveticus]